MESIKNKKKTINSKIYKSFGVGGHHFVIYGYIFVINVCSLSYRLFYSKLKISNAWFKCYVAIYASIYSNRQCYISLWQLTIYDTHVWINLEQYCCLWNECETLNVSVHGLVLQHHFRCSNDTIVFLLCFHCLFSFLHFYHHVANCYYNASTRSAFTPKHFQKQLTSFKAIILLLLYLRRTDYMTIIIHLSVLFSSEFYYNVQMERSWNMTTTTKCVLRSRWTNNMISWNVRQSEIM